MNLPISLSRSSFAHFVAVLACLLLWCAAPAAAQDTPPTQAEPPPPTETTPEPAPPPPPPEPDPAPAPEPSDGAPGEYVESVPTGSGSSPSSPQPGVIAPAAAAAQDETVAAAARKRKSQKKDAEKKKRRENVAPTPASPGPPVPTAATGPEVGDSARLLWLGLALLVITGGVVSTALARRRRASI